MAYSRPGSYPEPPVFKTLADVQTWSKQLYAAMWDNDRQAEEFAYRTTDKDIKGLMFRPEWYGAKGDGIADDKAGIQAALDAANAAGGGQVFLGPATYLLKSGLTYGSDTSIVGCGGETILEVYSGGASGFYVLVPKAAGVSNVLMSGFTIDAGSDHFAATATTYAVSVDKTTGVTIDNVRFTNIDTMAVWCDTPAATPTTKLVIRNCRVETSKSGGFSLFGTLTDFAICDNYITGCGDDAIAVQEGTANGQPTRGVIRGNRILNCITRGGPGVDATPNGILIYGGTYIAITGNEISGVVACGIRVQYSPSYPSQFISVTGNTITNTGVQVGTMTGVPVHGIYVLESNNISVSGNSVDDSYGYGIFVHDTDLTGAAIQVTGNVSVTGNSVSLNHYAGIYFLDIKDSIIAGNICMGNGLTGDKYGILINSTDTTHFCEDIIITGNRCGDDAAYGAKTQTYGLAIISANNRKIQITGNNFEGNETASITSATGSPDALFWHNTTSVKTAIKTAAILGATNIYVDSTALMTVGDRIKITLDTPATQETTIAAILDVDLLTLAEGLDDAAAEDNAVEATSWKLYLPFHDTLVWSFDAPVETSKFYDTATGGTYKVDGTQVVGARVVDARLADTPNSGDATTDGLIDALRDLVISHGLGAAT